MQRPAIAVAAFLVAAGLATFLLLGRGEAPPEPPPTPSDPPPDATPIDPTDAEPELRGTSDASASGEAAPSESTPRPELQEAAADVLRVTGRVLDDRRRAVAGVAVTVSSPTSSGVGRTASDGTFAASMRRPDARGASILAYGRHPDGRVGVSRAAWIRPDTERADLGTLLLGAPHTLEAEVTDATGARAPDVTVGLFWFGFGGGALLDEQTTDAEGRVRFSGVAQGGVRLVAVAAGRGRGTAAVAVPAKKPVAVALSASHTLVVRVVDKDSGQGIADATVHLEEYARGSQNRAAFLRFWPEVEVPRTDAEGESRVEGLAAADQIYLAAWAEGYPQGQPPSRRAWGFPVFKSPHVVELAKTRTLTFPVGEGEVPAPADGTVLTLETQPGAMTSRLPDSIRMAGGQLVGEGFEQTFIHTTAVAPDGSRARLFCPHDEDTGHEAVFQRPRFVEVSVTRADGSPAEGVWIHARGGGNNLVGGPVQLDASGEARLGPVPAYRTDVFLSFERAEWGGLAIGTVNAEEKSGRIEHVLAPARRIVLEMSVDGARRLPPDFWVRLAGLDDREEDPDAAEVHLTAHPPEGMTAFAVGGAGYLEVQAELPADTGDDPVRIPVDLRSGAQLVVELKPPSDGRYQLVVQAFNDGEWSWAMGGRQPQGRQPTKEQLITHRLGPLTPGRYRVLDSACGMATEAVDIEPGAGDQVVPFDLSGAGNVQGTVRVPDGIDVREARVRVVGAAEGNPFTRGEGAYVRHGGAFHIRVSGDREVELVPWHPLLVPSKNGRATVKNPGEGVVLELEHGATVRFRIAAREDLAPAQVPHAGPQGGLAVTRYPTGFEGKTLEHHRAQAVEGQEDVWRFGGFEPGTYALLFDVPGWMPVRLPSVELGGGETVLGDVTLRRGSAVRIQVQTKEGQDPPRINALARALEGPSVYRYVNSNGEAEVLLTGLAAGRYDLVVRSMAGFGSLGAGTVPIETEIEVDGTNDVTLEFDLR